ncbi:bola protein [Durotheca rogersii]|uniref:bola protein n=1 Tax=Durotheca rogersii TaxID=419775 RepID=UPI00221ED762|nr:bola protein [Durotheca rogersii]KAI5864872.1 bola protein [Durotheca rogersii]
MLPRHVHILPRAAIAATAATRAALPAAAPAAAPPPARQLATMASSSSPPPTTTSNTPMEDAIRAKITQALQPSRLEIYNDSAKHAHHAPMVAAYGRPGAAAADGPKETHFRLVITSAAFVAKPQPARHRLVYRLLAAELAAEGGVHALQLSTTTPDEEERKKQRAAEAATAAAADE